GSAPPSPEPSAPEMAPLHGPRCARWLVPPGGPVFVSPPDQFSLSPDIIEFELQFHCGEAALHHGVVPEAARAGHAEDDVWLP
ncbi:MAG: hypothetical protein AAFX78_18640, partial [Cyanobacteria bacterium J06638_20]